MRIVSTDGNVIKADFRRRDALSIDLTVTSEVLYRDHAVMLTRTTAHFNGSPFMVTHFVGDFATATVTQL